MKFAFAESMHTLANEFEQAEMARHEAAEQRHEAEKRRHESERKQQKQRMRTAAERHAQVMQFRSAIDSEMKEMRTDFQRGHHAFMERNTATNRTAGEHMHHARKPRSKRAHAEGS